MIIDLDTEVQAKSAAKFAEHLDSRWGSNNPPYRAIHGPISLQIELDFRRNGDELANVRRCHSVTGQVTPKDKRQGREKAICVERDHRLHEGPRRAMPLKRHADRRHQATFRC